MTASSSGIRAGKVRRAIGAILAITALLATILRCAGHTPLETIRGGDLPIQALALSRDARLVAYSVALDSLVRIHDRRLGRVVKVISIPSDFIASMAFAPDGNTLTIAVWIDQIKQAWTWDVSGPRARVLGEVPDALVPSRHSGGHESWSGDVSAEFDRKIRLDFDSNLRPRGFIIVDARTNEPISRKIGHPDGINDWLFTPDGTILVTAGGFVDHPWPVNRSGDARLWDVATGGLLATLSTRWIWSSHWGGIGRLAISGDGGILATGGVDGLIKLWDVGSITHQNVRSRPH